ncbi:MAG: hypothetical protein OSB75_01615 [Dehalococcoidia bacterium]|nr:hypothetical protein [Dehalococcoidia bacterium]MDE0824342.1 hypothetical protein [Dehalococcoidia bacterium]|tara:strand:+ start:43 stop:378 length:336 start_codon:yes stop_codon:yes gene_type:complete
MPEPMTRESQDEYIQMAVDNPEMTCADAPADILEFASAEQEPTPFMEAYFAAGHGAWLTVKHGRRIAIPQNLLDRAILVLWNRAGLLNTDRILGQTNPDAEKPFFSDEDLY